MRGSEVQRPVDVLSRPVSRRNALKVFANTGIAVGGSSALMTFLAACGSGNDSSTNAAGGGGSFSSTQRGALAVAFDAMDPAVSPNGVTINLMFYVYEALYRAKISDPTAFVAQLAAGDPEQVSNTVYRVRIRPGARFSSGDPVTADDVVFSFNRLKRLGDASFLGKYVVNFDKMSAAAPDTVEIKLKAPMALLEERLAVIKILSKRAVQTGGRSVLEYRPVGSGPYQVLSAEPSTSAKLGRVAGYNGPLSPSFPAKEIDFSIVTDPSAQLSGLQSKRFDAIAEVLLSSVATLERSNNLRVASPAGHAIHGFLFNAGRAPFKDVRVRQAIMYGLDRDAIVKAAYFGNASVADAMVPRENADFTAPTTIYAHDPEKARSLLAAAGHKDGLDYELMVGSNITGMTDAAQVMQQQLGEIGVNVTLKSGDLGALYANVTAGKYDSLYAPSSPAILGSADAEFVYRWLYYGTFTTDYLFWNAPARKQLEQLLDQALTASSTDAYKSTMAQVIDIVAEQGPFAPVMLVNNPVAWNPSTCSAITPSHVGNLYMGKGL